MALSIEQTGASTAASTVLAATADVHWVQTFKAVALSQLDDWLHRGDSAIVSEMSLYVYSLWVYRVELPYWKAGDRRPADASAGQHIDIPFDESYSAAKNWVQRLAEEPRLPNFQGFQFVSETPDSAEMHYLLKSVLLRPAHLPCADEAVYTRELRYLKAYEAFCTAPAGEEAWTAQRLGPESPGPFQRGLTGLMQQQEELASTARVKCLSNDCCPWSYPSIWNTREVAEVMSARRAAGAATPDDVDATFSHATSDAWPAEYPYEDMLSAVEYCALEALRTARIFDGIALARSTKPKRQVDVDQKAPEQQPPVFWEGVAQSGDGDAQVEGGRAACAARPRLAPRECSYRPSLRARAPE